MKKKVNNKVKIEAIKDIGRFRKGTIYQVGAKLADELIKSKKAKKPGTAKKTTKDSK